MERTKYCSFYQVILTLTVMLILRREIVQAGENSIDESFQEIVCQSIQISGSPNNLESFENCTVIEGYVSLVNFKIENGSSLLRQGFSKLREITEYLLLYRVSGLITVGQLFPNLTVIRGRQVLKDYSLIIYEMDELRSVSLYELSHIANGSVRIEKNINLCYVDTINWDILAPADPLNNVIRLNKDEMECDWCPGDESDNIYMPYKQSTTSVGYLQCPLDARYSIPKHLCWDRQHCQKVCPVECEDNTCTANGKCCDHTCLGSCSANDERNCTVCRGMVHIENGIRTCVQSCPSHLFKYNERRCISELQCRHLPNSQNNENQDISKHYKIHNGTCIAQCPFRYRQIVESNGTITCENCLGPCYKECPAGVIDSIEAAEDYAQCTHISGSLEISIKSGENIVKELKKNLRYIQVIDGMLRIVNSYPLMTLQFLRSLKSIKGKDSTDGSNYNISLYVFDNPNLMHLWDWQTHGAINISNGQMFFHFNPKLCFVQLGLLSEKMNYTEYQRTNGNNVHCDGHNKLDEKTALELNVTSNMNNAILNWSGYCPYDSRIMLGYLVYYMPTNEEKVMMYDDRDFCDDPWSVDNVLIDTKAIDCNIKSTYDQYSHLLTHLQPFTRYALYVKSYNIDLPLAGAISEIVYFTTLPGMPTSPHIESAHTPSPNEIKVKWKPPLQPNGINITYYVSVNLQEYHEDILSQRNYCEEPMDIENMEKSIITTYEDMQRKERISDYPQEYCKCENKQRTVVSDEYFHDVVHFENALMNEIFIRGKRSLNGYNETKYIDNWEFGFNNSDKLTTVKEKNDYHIKHWKKTTERELLFDELKHFSLYAIFIWACRQSESNENNSAQNCSRKTVHVIRTKKLNDADKVDGILIEVNYDIDIKPKATFKWTDPPKPNGAILTYNLVYEHVTKGIMKHLCISRRQFVLKNYSVIETIVEAGNYSIMVSVTSLAGHGKWSEKIYFHVEERGTPVIIYVVVAIALILICACLFLFRKKILSSRLVLKLLKSLDISYTRTRNNCELLRSNIELLNEIGEGTFGAVYEGLLLNSSQSATAVQCAVKVVTDSAPNRAICEILNKASTMMELNSWHVVRFYGIVKKEFPIMLVTELMGYGDLKSYLFTCRRNTRIVGYQNRVANHLPLKQVKKMALEIADGMAYLSAKGFVHKDLSARNCAVSEDLTIKVSDFGITRKNFESDYYQKDDVNLLPVRWMSPESLLDVIYTTTSDVWSYGVVLWEIVTLAMQPYQNLSNEQVLRYVMAEGIMEKPDNCPDELYNIMMSCWQQRPHERPTFMQIASELSVGCSHSFIQNSYFHSLRAHENFIREQSRGEGEEIVNLNVETSTARLRL